MTDSTCSSCCTRTRQWRCVRESRYSRSIMSSNSSSISEWRRIAVRHRHPMLRPRRNRSIRKPLPCCRDRGSPVVHISSFSLDSHLSLLNTVPLSLLRVFSSSVVVTRVVVLCQCACMQVRMRVVHGLGSRRTSSSHGRFGVPLWTLGSVRL